jgi:hypothetical protein
MIEGAERMLKMLTKKLLNEFVVQYGLSSYNEDKCKSTIAEQNL